MYSSQFWAPGGAESVQVKGMKHLNNRIHELYKEELLQAFRCDIYEQYEVHRCKYGTSLDVEDVHIKSIN